MRLFELRVLIRESLLKSMTWMNFEQKYPKEAREFLDGEDPARRGEVLAKLVRTASVEIHPGGRFYMDYAPFDATTLDKANDQFAADKNVSDSDLELSTRDAYIYDPTDGWVSDLLGRFNELEQILRSHSTRGSN